jgi:predicted PurR-regulated permease PerM
VLQPTIVGRAVSLSAPVTMLSTIVGLTVAGIPGALFAVPTTGAVKAVAQHVRGIDPAPVEPRPGVIDRIRRHRRATAAPDDLNEAGASPEP